MLHFDWKKCCSGAIEPLSILLVTTGLWATVEEEILTIVNRMAAAKAIKPDSLDSTALVASLCGMLHPDEHKSTVVDQAVHILLQLSEQGTAQSLTACTAAHRGPCMPPS